IGRRRSASRYSAHGVLSMFARSTLSTVPRTAWLLTRGVSRRPSAHTSAGFVPSAHLLAAFVPSAHRSDPAWKSTVDTLRPPPKSERNPSRTRPFPHATVRRTVLTCGSPMSHHPDRQRDG